MCDKIQRIINEQHVNFSLVNGLFENEEKDWIENYNHKRHSRRDVFILDR